MSEEKLYLVKNDEGEYWDFYDEAKGFDPDYVSWLSTTQMRDKAEKAAKKTGGHVVTFVEEPEKVVISKTNALRQGWLVARYGQYNPDAVSDILARYKDEAWDMIEAYVNGYTVEKEKKYNAKMSPDDLPMIPAVVGEILQSSHGQDDLLGVLEIAKNGRKVSEPLAWMISNQNAVARAWLLGVWRVEETGEIVKLEAQHD